jgi:CheY-like chemotaxis protein
VKEGTTMETASGKKPFILVAEDDPTNQYVFRKLLEKAGYDILIVENGQEALEAYRKRRPDLILLDMMMPVMNGYEAVRRMIQDPFLDGVPILALTANAMRGDEQKTLEAGCDDHISKPIQMGPFLQKVKEWLERDPQTWMPQRMSRREPLEKAG